jgi:uncharacterized membrane protein YdbT with pleckstrin-like domain
MGVRRSHPAPLLAFLSCLLCCLFAAGVLSAVFPEGSALRVIWTAWGLILLSFAWNVAAWSVQYILITDMRLMVVRGLITRKITMMPIISITDMYFERPLFGQLFGYGTFSFASSSVLRVLKYVPYPERLYRDIFTLALSRESDSAHGG